MWSVHASAQPPRTVSEHRCSPAVHACTLCTWLALALGLKYTDWRGIMPLDAVVNGSRCPRVSWRRGQQHSQQLSAEYLHLRTAPCASPSVRRGMLQRLLGCTTESDAWRAYVREHGGGDPRSLEVKQYPDMHYYNLRERGVSFQFEPHSRKLVTLDVYNAQPRWGRYPSFPEPIQLQEREVQVTPELTGIDFVHWLGEPARKGGAHQTGQAGGAAAGPAAWMEWACTAPAWMQGTAELVYVQVELATAGAGPAAVGWGVSVGRCRWAVLTLSIRPA